MLGLGTQQSNRTARLAVQVVGMAGSGFPGPFDGSGLRSEPQPGSYSGPAPPLVIGIRRKKALMVSPGPKGIPSTSGSWPWKKP